MTVEVSDDGMKWTTLPEGYYGKRWLYWRQSREGYKTIVSCTGDRAAKDTRQSLERKIMAKPITAGRVTWFMGELMVYISSHPDDEKVLAIAREALAKLDALATSAKKPESGDLESSGYLGKPGDGR